MPAGVGFGAFISCCSSIDPGRGASQTRGGLPLVVLLCPVRAGRNCIRVRGSALKTQGELPWAELLCPVRARAASDVEDRRGRDCVARRLRQFDERTQGIARRAEGGGKTGAIPKTRRPKPRDWAENGGRRRVDAIQETDERSQFRIANDTIPRLDDLFISSKTQAEELSKPRPSCPGLRGSTRAERERPGENVDERSQPTRNMLKT